ncbi:MAG: DUF1646 family protein [Candidatus Binataceae bacterium]
MNLTAGIIILFLLLFGPLAVHLVERNIEAWVLILGIIAVTLGGGWTMALIEEALTDPVSITAAVLGAGLVFNLTRHRLDRGFARLRAHAPRPLLTGVMIFIIAAISSFITAIIAALVLVEIIGLLKLRTEERINVAVVGCFAVGLGAALTPIGEPLSTLAAKALGLGFFGLFDLLGPFVIPGIIACVLLAAYFAAGTYDFETMTVHARETTWRIILRAIKVYGFIAGLVLISEAYAPLAHQVLARVSTDALFWINIVSAALDNATLVALEIHGIGADRAREAIVALLVSGGILVPGNIPNIVSAGTMHIRSTRWAKTAAPIGLILLACYFAAFKLLG